MLYLQHVYSVLFFKRLGKVISNAFCAMQCVERKIDGVLCGNFILNYLMKNTFWTIFKKLKNFRS